MVSGLSFLTLFAIHVGRLILLQPIPIPFSILCGSLAVVLSFLTSLRRRSGVTTMKCFGWRRAPDTTVTTSISSRNDHNNLTPPCVTNVGIWRCLLLRSAMQKSYRTILINLNYSQPVRCRDLSISGRADLRNLNIGA